jgi:hypothetical protein
MNIADKFIKELRWQCAGKWKTKIDHEWSLPLKAIVDLQDSEVEVGKDPKMRSRKLMQKGLDWSLMLKLALL